MRIESPLERRLALTLSLGTVIGTLVTAVGFLLSFRFPLGANIEMCGVTLFILLPVIRVALMLHGFARQREWLFAVLAALVLLIIAAGAVVGIRSPAAG